MAVGGKAEHLIPLGTDDIQALGADGTGRTQQRDFLDISYLLHSVIENSDDHHGDERRNEHDAVEAVQNAAVAREDGAIILDAALALDHAGEQVAVDAQHSGHAGQQGNDQVHGNADVGAGERLHPVGRNGVDDGGDHAEHHGAQHAANGSLHGLLGLTTGQSLCLPKALPAK